VKIFFVRVVLTRVSPGLKMFAKWILAILAVCSFGRFPDLCSELQPFSYCVQGGARPGFCSGTSPVSCQDAYDEASTRDLLRPATEPPILVPRPRMVLRNVPVDPSFLSAAPLVRSALSRYFKSAKICFNHYREHFPYIRFQHDHAIDLLAATRRVVRRWSEVHANEIRRNIYQSEAYANVWVLLNMGINYLYASDHNARSGVFANFIPYLYTWTSVLRILELPSPFASPRYVEILTASTKYLPRNFNETWMIEMDAEMGRQIVLPILPSSDSNDLMLIISDFLKVPGRSSYWLMSKAAISHRLWPANPVILDLVRSSLALELHHRSDNFCAVYLKQWMAIISAMSPVSIVDDGTLFKRRDLLHLFRICGKQYLELAFRVRVVLPAVIAPKSARIVRRDICASDGTFDLATVGPKLTGIKPVYLMSDSIELACNHQILDSRFLSVYVYNITIGLHQPADDLPSNRKQLMGQGIAIGLLLLAGDPHEVLESLLSLKVVPNYFLNSLAIRSGFCQVVDCAVFDALFDDDEIPQVLSILRSHNIFHPNTRKQ
jgi:hypothetical protein